jgi:hypothetical protein
MTKILTDKTLYDTDFNLWLEQTVQQIKNHQFDAVDWSHLLEEIESLSKSDKREIKRRLTLILSHLLCLAFWLPELERKQCARGWRLTVREQRQQVKELLNKSPSLRSYLNLIFAECYQDAREEVLYKSPFSWDLQVLIPQECPFTIAETLNSDDLI